MPDADRSPRDGRDAASVVTAYLEALAGHDWEGARACLDPDVVRIGPFGDTYTPREPYLAFLADLMPQLPGYRLRIDRVVAAGDTVTAELTETVASGDGTPVDTPEALVFDLERGRITRIAIYIQRLGG